MTTENTATPGAEASNDNSAATETSANQAGQEQIPETPADANGQPDDVYEAAFNETMAQDFPSGSGPRNNENTGTTQGTGINTDATAEQTDPTPTGDGAETQVADLSADQQQLLKRGGITPEMIASWTPEQKAAWFDHNGKREGDQTRSYKELSERLKAIEAGGNKDKGGETGDGETPQDPNVKAAIDTVNEILGDDVGEALGPVLNQLTTTNNQLNETVQAQASVIEASNRVVVDLTIDNGIRDLKADFPSLNKADARKQVIEKFGELWNAENSELRTGKGPLLDRVRDGLKSAATTLFSTQTESAAQASLVNTTKERLANQPTPGSGRGREEPKSEDDLYDQAFADTMGKEI